MIFVFYVLLNSKTKPPYIKSNIKTFHSILKKKKKYISILKKPNKENRKHIKQQNILFNKIFQGILFSNLRTRTKTKIQFLNLK